MARLSNLMLNRVDLVPAGSNPDSHIVLFKSKEAGVAKALKKKTKVPAKKAKPDTRKKKAQEDEDEEDDDLVEKNEDENEDDDEEEEEDDDAIEKDDDDDEEDDDDDAEDDEDDEPVAKGGKGGGKGGGKTAKGGKAVKGKGAKKATKKSLRSEDDDEEEEEEEDELDSEVLDVLKTLPKHVQEGIARTQRTLRQLRKETREASDIAKDERNRRQTLEFVARAKTTIPHLSGTDQEKGELLKAMFSGEPLSKSDAKALLKLLKSGDAAVKNLLMSETGSTRRPSDDDNDDPISLLREKQDEIMKQADFKGTKEQAFEKACILNPDLYKQYRSEKRRATNTTN